MLATLMALSVFDYNGLRMPEGKSGSREPVAPRQPSRKKSVIDASLIGIAGIEFVRVELDPTTGLINQWVTAHAPVVQINEITSLTQKVIGDNDKARKWLQNRILPWITKRP